MRIQSVVVAAGIALLAGSAQASVIWNESVNGDLSGDGFAPNNLVFSAGVNSLIATSQAGDREYVHFSLPAGTSLTAIVHVSWDSIDSIAFIGVQSGSVFTEPPTGTNVGNLLGWAHFGPGLGTVGTDILDDMGTGPGAIGFTPPLTGSDYTFWLQQTSPVPATYQLDFMVVPAPGALALLSTGFFALRRRR